MKLFLLTKWENRTDEELSRRLGVTILAKKSHHNIFLSKWIRRFELEADAWAVKSHYKILMMLIKIMFETVTRLFHSLVRELFFLSTLFSTHNYYYYYYCLRKIWNANETVHRFTTIWIKLASRIQYHRELNGRK